MGGTYVSNLRDTLIAEQDRGDEHFYRTWGIVYGSWFLALPLATVLSYFVLATYVRHIASLVITQGATFVAFGALVAGLWPLSAKPHFKLAFAAVEDVLESCVTPKSVREKVEKFNVPKEPFHTTFGKEEGPTL